MQCNNYEIIDLGVMVPCEQIVDTAIKENVDIIGLSGLITPSLDEMVHVVRELERRGLNIPVMIGGATTSKAHTAVKMEHEYSAPIVYVNNASRGVTVAQSLLSKELRLGFLKKLRDEYAFERKLHEIKYSKNVSVSYEVAKQNCIKLDYAKTKAKTPNMYGVQVLDIDINSVKKFIDWQGFVSSWDYKVNVDKLEQYPNLKEDVEKLLDDGKEILNELIQQNKLTVKVQFGLFKTCKSDTDDLVVTYQDKQYKFSFLRNQLDMNNRDESSNYCLTDFFDDEDSIGIIVVNAGIGLDKILAELKADDEIYKMMLTQTVADRIAEATTEYAHYLVRTKYWGYSCEGEVASLSELNYKGIRPAVGYSTASDHRQKKIIWDLLDCENNIGLSLTESYMMNPVSATCCFILGNSEAYYSSVGGVMKDQILSYSLRTNTTVSETEHYLQRELAYIVEDL
jgi:5-methyltetrahydrofolate--homocysteine methyltransferase